MVTLYGNIVRRTDKEILLAIASKLGDARDFGLCGEVWFAKRLLVGEITQKDGFDVIRVPPQVASLKAQSCQPCE